MSRVVNIDVDGVRGDCVLYLYIRNFGMQAEEKALCTTLKGDLDMPKETKMNQTMPKLPPCHERGDNDMRSEK